MSRLRLRIAMSLDGFVAAGLVDEMEISLVPTLLGSGERMFGGVGDDLHGLELVRTVAAPDVTHLKYARP
jgi:dihydrofolate reductase